MAYKFVCTIPTTSVSSKRTFSEDEEREKKVQFRSQKLPINELYKIWCKQEKKEIIAMRK